MNGMLHGLKDIHMVIANSRKLGGAAEAESITLSSGEIYINPVFTNVDLSQGKYVSFSFIAENGENITAHVDQIGVMKGLRHKLICQLENKSVREMMTEESLRYLKKLCEVNEGFVTNSFKKEALRLVRDVSVDELEKRHVNLPFAIDSNVVSITKRKFA
ncbi:hypothetical protein [Domibacillus indicus]|uniref:hypothetical protein n=1 Tax=Domibacillus indicus TaxID=1437523 RepID=UPI00061817F4|nr:hypothetical protein [Domibacillus indicus]